MSKQFKRIDLLKNNHIHVDLDRSDVEKSGDITEKSTSETVKKPARESLINSFVKLVPHLLFTCRLAKPETFDPEWFSQYEFLDDPRFEGISVTGVVMVGKDDLDGVKILGRVTHPNGDVVALNGPIVYFEQQGEHKYALVKLLEEHVDDLILETKEYYLKKKYGQEPQLSLLDE